MSKNKRWLLPILAMLILTPFTPALDLAISHYFFDDQSFVTNPLVEALYFWGLIPPQLAFILGCFLFGLSFLRKKWERWRKPGVALVLALGLGSGLITNAILKDHWGRPRPRQTIEFGGTQEFRPFWKPNFFNQPEPSKSFPSGHASAGFYFFILIFIGKRTKHPKIRWLGWILGLGVGIALSITRIAQGGHFFSDTLMSALIMWLTANLIDWLIFSEEA